MQKILEKLIQIEKMISIPKSPWMSVSECASYMRISERQFRKFLSEGKIKYKRIGCSTNGRILIHRTWVDAFIMGFGTRLTPFQKSQLEKLGVN